MNLKIADVLMARLVNAALNSIPAPMPAPSLPIAAGNPYMTARNQRRLSAKAVSSP